MHQSIAAIIAVLSMALLIKDLSMNVYRAKSGQLWFEVSRSATHIKLHNEMRTGWEFGPEELTLKDFNALGYVLMHTGKEGMAIARDRIGNLLLRREHPLETSKNSTE